MMMSGDSGSTLQTTREATSMQIIVMHSLRFHCAIRTVEMLQREVLQSVWWSLAYIQHLSSRQCTAEIEIVTSTTL